MRLVVEGDGGSRGNPGPAGYGAVVRDAQTGEVLAEVAEAIGVATNNVAEYRALIAGLEAAAEIAPRATLEVRMDSKLVVEQMSGRWRIKHPDLLPLADRARRLAAGFGKVRYGWVPRERNTHADRLANEAMDAAAQGRPWSRHAGGSAPAGSGTPRASSGAPSAASGSSSSGDAESEGDRRPEAATQLALGAEPGGGPTSAAAAAAPSATPSATASSAASTATSSASELVPPQGQAPGLGPVQGPGWILSSSPPTVTLLLRHGETPLSIERRYAGIGDIPLTERGIAQAKAAATALGRRGGIDVIVTSPLRRTRQTAAEVAAVVDAEVHEDEGFREMDFGEWEGLTFAEARARWPAESNAWLDPSIAPPGGESLAMTLRRVREARERVTERFRGRTVLIVTHVTPIKLLVRMALLAPPEAMLRMQLEVACLSSIDWYDDGTAVLRSLNDVSHLG
jgi:ribonuclease H / adenosylcobalamin/alpha-ribazole phosphatase